MSIRIRSIGGIAFAALLAGCEGSGITSSTELAGAALQDPVAYVYSNSNREIWLVDPVDPGNPATQRRIATDFEDATRSATSKLLAFGDLNPVTGALELTQNNEALFIDGTRIFAIALDEAGATRRQVSAASDVCQLRPIAPDNANRDDSVFLAITQRPDGNCASIADNVQIVLKLGMPATAVPEELSPNFKFRNRVYDGNGAVVAVMADDLENGTSGARTLYRLNVEETFAAQKLRPESRLATLAPAAFVATSDKTSVSAMFVRLQCLAPQGGSALECNNAQGELALFDDLTTPRLRRVWTFANAQADCRGSAPRPTPCFLRSTVNFDDTTAYFADGDSIRSVPFDNLAVTSSVLAGDAEFEILSLKLTDTHVVINEQRRRAPADTTPPESRLRAVPKGGGAPVLLDTLAAGAIEVVAVGADQVFYNLRPAVGAPTAWIVDPAAPAGKVRAGRVWGGTQYLTTNAIRTGTVSQDSLLEKLEDDDGVPVAISAKFLFLLLDDAATLQAVDTSIGLPGRRMGLLGPAGSVDGVFGVNFGIRGLLEIQRSASTDTDVYLVDITRVDSLIPIAARPDVAEHSLISKTELQ